MMNYTIKTEEPSDFPKFKDIIGIEKIKEDFQEIVEFINNSQKYEDIGATLPKGILLTGPPGTGKTYLAKALANECGCNFYYKSSSQLEDMFVGETSKKIKKLFKEAKKNSPSVIFLDEIDSIAGKREIEFGNSNDGKFNFSHNTVASRNGWIQELRKSHCNCSK
jgi:ATP-dependent metalloprotease